MDVSIVTSLYRSENHLEQYIHHALRVAQTVSEQGLTLEFVLIPNAANDRERELIRAFQAAYNNVQVHHVPLETVYTSWNRGVRAATAEVIGFWNADDVRTVEGIVRGVQAIHEGCKLVYFAHEVVRMEANRRQSQIYEAIPYTPEAHRRVHKCGPFFMFHRDLYDEIGGFDEHFRITGDHDWCVRATYKHDLCPVHVVAGTFYLHGGNLSDTGNPRQEAETNMVHLLNGQTEYVKPVQPDMMRETWESWGDVACPISDAMKTHLWGDGAENRWKQYRMEQANLRQRQLWSLRIRYIPKRIVDALYLRPLLARLGIVKAREKAGEPR